MQTLGAEGDSTPARLEAVTIKAKPHLRIPGQALTLCKRLGNVRTNYTPPPATTICKRCLAHAKKVGLLCSGCGEPMIITSDIAGVCRRCAEKTAHG